MKLFMCFGGAAAAAAVVGDEVAMATKHQGQRRRGRRSLSFRGKSFLPGNKYIKGGNEKKPSAVPPLDERKKRGMDADDDAYGVSRASSVASSVLLSSAPSLDSDTSASSSSASSRCSTASSSPSVSGVLYPPPVKRQASNNNKRPAASSYPAAGAAAVVLCLLMVVFCGRVGATLLTSMALYLFPRRWPARTTTREEEKRPGAVDSLECDAEEERTAKRKVVMEGSLVRNRNK